MCRASQWRHRESSFSDEATCYHSTMDLTNNFNFFNYKYKFLITNRVIIIIGLLVYNNYYFYYKQDYIRHQLSMKILAWNLNWKVTQLFFLNTFL